MSRDPFRTLDDPDPAPAGAIAGDVVAPRPWLGYWRAPAARPGRLRRLIVWLVFGWRWQE